MNVTLIQAEKILKAAKEKAKTSRFFDMDSGEIGKLS